MKYGELPKLSQKPAYKCYAQGFIWKTASLEQWILGGYYFFFPFWFKTWVTVYLKKKEVEQNGKSLIKSINLKDQFCKYLYV